MNCPHCNTVNDPANQFCVSCGQPIHIAEGAPPARPAGGLSAGETLSMLTLHLALSLLGVWLLRAVLMGLSFVKQFQIPDFDVPTVSLISALAYLFIILIVINYARSFAVLWPQAVRGYPALGSLLVSFLYIIVLSALYKAFQPFIIELDPDPEMMLFIQGVLIVLALFILGRAFLLAYQGLAPWLSGWIVSLRPPKTPHD
ncbi:MAG: zinc ribbon domain-containing protein [Chloroflexi bacterium]|nr:zinc ribbon domain-containing protein [Chloroflexota bacterium]